MRKEDKFGNPGFESENQKTATIIEQIKLNREISNLKEKPTYNLQVLSNILLQWGLGVDAGYSFWLERQAPLQKALIGLNYHVRTSRYLEKMDRLSQAVRQGKSERIPLNKYAIPGFRRYPPNAVEDVFSFCAQDLTDTVRNGTNSGIHDLLSDLENKKIPLTDYRNEILKGNDTREIIDMNMVHTLPTRLEGVRLEVVSPLSKGPLPIDILTQKLSLVTSS